MTSLEQTWSGKRVVGKCADPSRLAFLTYSEKDGFRVVTRGAQLTQDEAILMAQEVNECLAVIRAAEYE